MNGNVAVPDSARLDFHIQEVLAGRRHFENAAQAVARMISEMGYKKIIRAGRVVYDYNFFREGKKHLIGWFEETNALVNFVEEAARGGASKELAFVLVGEPGNGKTFFIDYICQRYRRFLARPENTRYTFEFVNLDQLIKGIKQYGNIDVIQSQTFEDPMIFAMNLCGAGDGSKEYLTKLGFDDSRMDRLYNNYRPLGLFR